jgi:hypothetical protein
MIGQTPFIAIEAIFRSRSPPGGPSTPSPTRSACPLGRRALFWRHAPSRTTNALIAFGRRTGRRSPHRLSRHPGGYPTSWDGGPNIETARQRWLTGRLAVRPMQCSRLGWRSPIVGNAQPALSTRAFRMLARNPQRRRLLRRGQRRPPELPPPASCRPALEGATARIPSTWSRASQMSDARRSV